MSNLSYSDLMKVLRAVELLNSGTGMETLADRSLSCILSLIKNEMTAFDGFDPTGEYTGYFWYSPPGTVSEESVRVLGELVHEHPHFAALVSTPGELTLRTSDSVSLSRFHQTALYNEFYKLFDGEAQISTAMRVSPTCVVTCSIHRPTMDFDDSELEALKLITPHLRAAFINAQAFEKVDSERKCLTAAERRGIVTINDHCAIVFINGSAEQLLQIYFGDYVPKRLPESLERHIKSEGIDMNGKDYCAPPRPYRTRNGDAELVIRLAFDAQARLLTLIFEERFERSKSDFCRLGMTERESEILFWMSKGKTNGEIGQICCISPRTVQKHVENLFVKLGVETRTSAVMAAIDRLND
jgi:DNA-binding CsgD family transcriptional regulator